MKTNTLAEWGNELTALLNSNIAELRVSISNFSGKEMSSIQDNSRKSKVVANKKLLIKCSGLNDHWEVWACL